MTDPVESLARTIAETAHDGQVDKAGEPYIGHCARVVARLDDPLDRAVAWLHDVLEDTAWNIRDLRDADEARGGLGGHSEEWQDVCDAVKRLMHRPNEPRADYYARIATPGGQRDRAVRVKLADIADNSDRERLALVDNEPPTYTRNRLERKYREARKALHGEPVPAPEGDDHQEAD